MIVPYDGFVGGTYRATSRRAGAEQAMNIYPEVLAIQGAKPPHPLQFVHCPGTRTFGTAGNGPVRDIYYEDGHAYCLSGSEMFEILPSGTTVKLGDVAQSSLPSVLAGNGTGGGQIAAIGGGLGFIYTPASGAFVQITDVDFPSSVQSLEFSDGYFLVTPYGTRQFNYSGRFNGLTWSSLDLSQKSQTTDNIQVLKVLHKEAWLIGSTTIEPWGNSGDLTATFAPIQGVLIQVGIAAIESARVIAGTLFWLGRDKNGRGQAYYAEGYSPKVFSHAGVQQVWDTYSRIDDAYAWTYQLGDHTFYVLTFPSARATWAYDLKERLWHERSYRDPATGNETAHLGRCHALAFDKHLVGSRIDGTIYELDGTCYYDADTRPLVKRRRSPHARASQRSLTMHSFEMSTEAGVANATGAGSDPQLMFRYSVDGGNEYSEEMNIETGKLGEYRTRASIGPLGQGDDWVLEVSSSEPLPVAWGNATVDVEGNNA